MRNRFHLLFPLLILSGRCMAVPKVEAPTLWVAPSARKVFKDDAAPAKPQTALKLAAARNECQAAQIVLHPDRDATLSGVSVGELTGPDGAALSAGNVRLYRVAYIYLPQHKKDFPDPLPPLTTPLNLKAGENQPLWVSVRVPEGTKTGRYRGEITLTFGDGSPRKVPLELTVWDFSIPVRPSMRTAFGISDSFIAAQHGVPAGSLKHRKLMDAYYEMLVSHRISPYTIPADIFSPSAARYLDDPRVTSFVIPYNDDETQLRKTVDYLRQKGWLAKGYFYVVDEPVNKDQYARLKEVCEKIHRVDPALKIVAPYFRDPDFDTGKTVYDLLPGSINIWCPVTAYYKPEPLLARQKLGEEAWWYVCCGPGKPYANFFVDMDGMAHRVLFWQQKKYGIQGLLYWNTTWWNPPSTKDPWADIATVKDINPAVYGDGSLLYPGAKAGIDGPVSSIRLELACEGMEDYEYLTLYEKRRGTARVQELIARVAKSLTEFSTDPVLLETVRAGMAREIEAGEKGKRL
jgi:hypothetical protein